MKTRTERVYVKVNTEFDTSGYMKPRRITWTDGRILSRDVVKDFRPADLHGGSTFHHVMSEGIHQTTEAGDYPK